MPDKLEELKERASQLFEGKNWDELIPVCTRILELEPKNGIAFFYLGLAYYKKGEYDRAIEYYNQAIEIDPKNSENFNNRGLAYFKKGEYDRAIEDHNQAIKLDPQDTSAFSNRGLAYYGKGEYDRAIEDYDGAIKLDPQNTSAFSNRGLAYARKGDFDRAIEDHNQAIKLDPQDTDAFSNRGLAYTGKGEYDRAIEDYDQAIELDPKNTNAIHNRAVAMALRQAAAEQEEIRKKYEAELEDYKSDVLEIENYKKREKEYKIKMIITVIVRWMLLIILFTLGIISYGSLISSHYFESCQDLIELFECSDESSKGPYESSKTIIESSKGPDESSKSDSGAWDLFRSFQIAILITLILSPLVWMIRWLGDDRNRLWALREDAYTRGILTKFVNEPQAKKVKLELILKLFEHHDQSSTAGLIANWDKPQPSGINPSDSIKLRDIIELMKQQKSE